MSVESCAWKNLPKNMNNPLHTICSYMAMFPPSLPHHFIEKYSNENDIVLDPFGGSGTTAFVAKEYNRKSIMIELNPEYCKLIRQRLRQEVLNI